MNPGKEKVIYRYGMAPAYWKYSWGSLPYGVTTLPRSDDLYHLPERWVSLERKIWQEFIDEVPNLHQKKILDLGCGAGKLIQFFLENNALSKNITALDENEQLIKWCSQVWKDVLFIQANATELNKMSKQKKFDLVASHMLFNLLNDAEMYEVLRITYKKMSGNGILAIKIPSSKGKQEFHSQLSSQSKLLHENTPWGTTPYYYRSENTIYHMLEKVGFKLERMTNYCYGSFRENTVHFTNTIGVNPNMPLRLFIVCKKVE